MARTEVPICTECGARAKGHEDHYCSYCGTAFPRAAPPVPRPSDTRAARFEVAKRSPAYLRALRHEPAAGHFVAGAACNTVFLIVFIGVGLMISGVWHIVGSGFGGAFPAISLLPLAMVGFAVFLGVKTIGRAAAVLGSPTEHNLVLVRDKRFEVRGGGGNSSASTHYYATLEYEDGTRREHEVDGKVASRIAPGDIGVACKRGGILLDFVELDA